MTNTETFRVSDDELVALSLRLEGRWMGPMPTVDETDTTSLLSARMRGERSITLRNSIFAAVGGGQTDLEGMSALIAPGVDRLPTMTGYVARSEDLDRPAGISFAVFHALEGAHSAQRLLALVLPNGTTELVEYSRDEAEGVVRALQDGAASAKDDDLALVVLMPTAQTYGESVVLRSGAATVRTYSAEGFGPGAEISSVDAADRVFSRI